jgi:hypothetical protein
MQAKKEPKMWQNFSMVHERLIPRHMAASALQPVMADMWCGRRHGPIFVEVCGLSSLPVRRDFLA